MVLSCGVAVGTGDIEEKDGRPEFLFLSVFGGL
jgi:hypothetical protein